MEDYNRQRELMRSLAESLEWALSAIDLESICQAEDPIGAELAESAMDNARLALDGANEFFAEER